MRVSIVGASGYIGGEALRLLLNHPEAELGQVTSERFAGKFVHSVHPNLRKRTNLKFSSVNELEESDVMFLALPHGVSMKRINEFIKLGDRIIDLSGDFRLNSKEDYLEWYGVEHANPDLLKKFVYGMPELHRDEIKKAKYVAGTGCLATASILGLYPLLKNDLVEPRAIIEAKVGSSAAGNKPSPGSHHPERSGAVRSFKPTRHRHTAEIVQELYFKQKPVIHFSATSIEMVRGILATSHVFLKQDISEKEIWHVYRETYGDEPFIRIVKEKTGVFRYPEPKLLSGTNYCDIGFEKDKNNRVVVMSAIDNLMKGGAGQGIQCMNIMMGFKEDLGLEFAGLHPI